MKAHSIRISTREASHTTTENQSHLAREAAWADRMARLEVIHAEISPQLAALRAKQSDP